MSPPSLPPNVPEGRWPFLRDVLVFQLKITLGNLLNFVLVPVSLIATAFDLIGRREPGRIPHFYRVLEISREIDERIDPYSAVGGYHATGRADDAGSNADARPGEAPEPGVSVDTMVRRVEEVIVRDYRRGGTAASLKAAVDRVLDELGRRPRR